MNANQSISHPTWLVTLAKLSARRYIPVESFLDKQSLPCTIVADVVASAQRADIGQCFEAVKLNLDGLQLLRDLRIGKRFEERRKKVIFAFLNRACELACTPLHTRYVETSNGAELAWFTYRPEAIPNEPYSWPDAVKLVGYVDDLTETEARSRAIGW